MPSSIASPSPDPETALNAAVQRCCEAYQQRLASERAAGASLYDIDQNAGDAFRYVMPFLSSPANIDAFIACVAQGMLLGAIDTDDASKLLYAAQVAIASRRAQGQPGRPKSEKPPTPPPPAPPPDQAPNPVPIPASLPAATRPPAASKPQTQPQTQPKAQSKTQSSIPTPVQPELPQPKAAPETPHPPPPSLPDRPLTPIASAQSVVAAEPEPQRSKNPPPPPPSGAMLRPIWNSQGVLWAPSADCPLVEVWC